MEATDRFTLKVTAVVINETTGKTISTTLQENNDMSYQTLVQGQEMLLKYPVGLVDWGKMRAGLKDAA